MYNKEVKENNIKKEIIYTLREKSVILDRDLADIYNIETRILNQTVKRNINLFNKEDYFQMTNEEFMNWKSLFVMSKQDKIGLRHAPYVFTERGVSTLTSIIKIQNICDINQKILISFHTKDKPLESSKIKDLIYEIRGEQVMLDSDLAMLYEVETRRINEAVARNKNKFPERFSWILTEDELLNLRSQIATSSLKNNYGGRRYDIRVFTEQGVAMLATILKSKTAIEVSIHIMDAFVTMRKYISTNLIEQKFINNLVLKDNKRIDLLESTFAKFDYKAKVNEIYFQGQIYDAYSKLVDIMQTAKKNLIIIDGYADKTVLDMIANLSIKVTLIVKTKSLIKNLDIKKYKEQYDNLLLIYDDSFHDRYIILDRSVVYHCGASLNHAGNRTFSVNILEDKFVKENLIENVEKIIETMFKM